MDTNTNRLMKQIESMTFLFPYRESGYAVDKITDKGTTPEHILYEEGVGMHVQIKGEMGVRLIDGPTALDIYGAVWKHFNNEENSGS
jgi:hypothetical protein